MHRPERTRSDPARAVESSGRLLRPHGPVLSRPSRCGRGDGGQDQSPLGYSIHTVHDQVGSAGHLSLRDVQRPPPGNWSGIHASSGTTGNPTVVGYTREDLDNWAEQVARLVVAAGASDESLVQICFGYGMFTGALGLHYGLERIGATVIPTSSGNTEKQLKFMRDFGTDTLWPPRPIVCIWPSRPGSGQRNSPSTDTVSSSVCWAARAVPPKCGIRSRKAGEAGSSPPTTTACPSSTAPACRANAGNGAVCISTRIIFSVRSSTRRLARSWPPVRPGNWWSPT